tara:strand:- start:440 stop:781 length:342 start_codon:yes stop_codon:yes gene_type:complete
MSVIPVLPEFPRSAAVPPEVTAWAGQVVKLLNEFMRNADRDYQTINGPIVLVPSTVSGLNGYSTESGNYRYKPALTQYSASRLAFCSNASGGAVPVYSTGTTWRRVTDGTVIT